MTRPSQIIIILSTITITSLVVTGYFYTELERLRTNPQILANNELQDIVVKVGQLIVLPDNEQPTLMTIADPEQLRDQPFFARAKTGDKVLVYNQAAKAILYDPVGNKIVEVAPITNSPSPASGS
ncbi:MAG: hypothetical protein AAB415_02645 [Patescibacteria group bacterium]